MTINYVVDQLPIFGPNFSRNKVYSFGKEETYNTLSKYIQEALLNLSTDPLSWQIALKNITSSDVLVDEISEKLKISKNIVFTFLNKTLTCTEEVLVEQAGLSDENLRAFLKKSSTTTIKAFF